MKKMGYHKMLGFVKKIFVSATASFGCNLSNVNPSNCVSMCKVRQNIININSNEPSFYSYRGVK